MDLIRLMIGPTKNQSLGLGVVFSVLMFLSFANASSGFGVCGGIFLLFAALYWFVAFRKISKDRALATRALAQRIEEPTVWASFETRQTTPGSERMFVPPPLPES